MAKACNSLPLKAATVRVAAELEGLYSRLERLEHALDTVFAHNSNTFDAKSISMLQELDMLRQSLGALSDFLVQVSQDTGPEGSVDPTPALQAVPLRDMAVRLGGQEKTVPVAGHAELF